MKKMNKKIIVTMSLLLLTTLLSSCFKDNEYIQKVPDTEKKVEEPIVETETKKIDKDYSEDELYDYDSKGGYTKYSEEKLKEAKGDIVLFFHADWCGTCKASKKNILEEGVPEGLSIFELNFDTETELKEKYGITSQTTFVQVDNEGNMIKKWSGGKLDKIIEEIGYEVIESIEEEKVSDDEKTEVMEESNVATKGLYTEYSETAIGEAKGDIVLFFHADWCPTCVASEKDIIVKGVPDGLTILKTNFDKETDLRKKYGVLAQTTFVQVDSEGNMIKKWVGGKLDDIVEEVNK